MTTARPSTTIARLLLFAAAVALALAAVGTRPAHASAKKSASPCWLQIINDWVPDGKVNGIYPIPCYRQAISHLNQYSDVKGYSSAVDDIRRAQQQAIRDKRNGITPTTTGTDGNSSTTPGGGGGNDGDNSSGGGKGFFQSIADRLGPGNAQSIPLPLLVLGGLALLLLLAALATWLARRIQSRRVTPAPAPAQRR